MSRADEKQASRDEDARRLAAGEVTAEELTKENSFFNLDGGIKLILPGSKSKIDPEQIKGRQIRGKDVRLTLKLPDGREYPITPFQVDDQDTIHYDPANVHTLKDPE